MVLLCAEDERCQCCGREVIQRLGTLLLNTFFCTQKPGVRTEAHTCRVCAVKRTSGFLGGVNSDRAQPVMARGALTRRV